MVMNDECCIFCDLQAAGILADSEFSFAINDRYPLSKGHVLIIPKRHVVSMFDLSDSEYLDMLSVMRHIRAQQLEEFQPDGWNIGINDGAAAGQTVMHLHLHLIPRYQGDVADPRGGIRMLFPERARYWELQADE